MRTAKEIIKAAEPTGLHGFNKVYDEETIIEIIESAQKEAYNEAIKDARADRPTKDDSWCISGSRNLYYVSSESILKLLKP